MSREPPRIPTYSQLLWRLFLQPVRLHLQLKACGIDQPNASGWSLLRSLQGDARSAARVYVRRMLLVHVFYATITLNLLLLTCRALDLPLEPVPVVGAFILVYLLGAASQLFAAVLSGMCWPTVLLAVVYVLYLGSRSDPQYGLGDAPSPHVRWSPREILIVWGFLLGAVRGMTRSAGKGSAVGLIHGLGEGFLWALVTQLALAGLRQVSSFPGLSAFASWFDAKRDSNLEVSNVLIELGTQFGAVLLGYAVALPRLYLWPFEAVGSTTLFLAQRLLKTPTLKFEPIDDLCCFPLPFLERHLLASADANPEIVRRALDACAIAPGLRWTGERALARLQALELDEMGRLRRFGDIRSPSGRWLPGVEAFDTLLLGFRDAGLNMTAAKDAPSPFNKKRYVDNALRALERIESRLGDPRSQRARFFAAPCSTWKLVAETMADEARQATQGAIQNPFLPGRPLTPHNGEELFVGRQSAVAEIRTLLGDPAQRSSVAVLGPRRAGKTSLLRMLPTWLPDTLCVFLDLQDHTLHPPQKFFDAVATAAATQARVEQRAADANVTGARSGPAADSGRTLVLPALGWGDPFDAARRWLERVDRAAREAGLRVLFCFDEFEKLEEAYRDHPAELLEIMTLLRATLQNRERIHLLIAGAAPFDELGDIWNSSLISLREVRIDLLDKDTSVNLLVRPTADFPPDTIPLEVAEAVFERTGGLPFLLQAYAFRIVRHIDAQKRKVATPEDVNAAESAVLGEWGSYFRQTVSHQKVPPAARAALRALARGSRPALDGPTRRWLRGRGLLAEHDRLRIPVIGAFIRHEEEDERVPSSARGAVVP